MPHPGTPFDKYLVLKKRPSCIFTFSSLICVWDGMGWTIGKMI